MQAADWPALHKWTAAHLAASYSARSTAVGDMPMALPDWLQYLRSSRDDMPLYLFDKGFCEAAPSLAPDFHVRLDTGPRTWTWWCGLSCAACRAAGGVGAVAHSWGRTTT